MDRIPEHLAALALLADIRRASGETRASTQTETNDEPNSLLEMFLNPEFIPPDLSASREVRPESPSLYDDLPPLEDDVSQSTAFGGASEGDEDDVPPLLEDASDDSIMDNAVPSPSTSFRTARLSGTSHIATNASRTSTVRTPTTRRRALVNVSDRSENSPLEDDPGAESDHSMPSLQSVSDSSADEDLYISDTDSDWDDEESQDASEEGSHIADEMIGSSARPSVAPLRIPLASTSSDERSMLSYTAIFQAFLDRAGDIDIIPDLPSFNRTGVLASRSSDVDSNPERAETLLTGMEIVPIDLASRYEELRTADAEGPDGCAICRDDLLVLDTSFTNGQAARTLEAYAALPFHPEPNCIIAFPCAGKHLFHRNCLSPWLARKPTCPTCRFDIDPLSLTLRCPRETTSPISQLEPSNSSRRWQPPRVESLSEWLHAEEQARVMGIPRTRSTVKMPEYPVSTSAGASLAGVVPPRSVRPNEPLFNALEDRIPVSHLDAFQSILARRPLQPPAPFGVSSAPPGGREPSPPSLLTNLLRAISGPTGSVGAPQLTAPSTRLTAHPAPPVPTASLDPRPRPLLVDPHPGMTHEPSQLHDAPLVLSPPPSDVDVNVLGERDNGDPDDDRPAHSIGPLIEERRVWTYGFRDGQPTVITGIVRSDAIEQDESMTGRLEQPSGTDGAPHPHRPHPFEYDDLD